MDHLYACAKAFEHLLDFQYHIIIGRKGKSVELNILFDSTEFHHLIGLHKLHDLRIARENRDKVFQQILTGNISMNDLKKSQYFPNIQKRIEPFIQIEKIHSTKYHHSPSSGSTCNAFCTVVNTRPFITPPCFLLWAADRTGYCTRIF